MEYQEKIEELRNILQTNLLPLIGKKVLIVDAPYYNNIGDVLIWQGTLDFLKNNNIGILGVHSENTFLFPPIATDVTILLMGGGNFGDLWRSFQDFRIQIIKAYPKNRIVMLPQSVYYHNEDLMVEDSNTFAAHKNLHLCARDEASYKFFSRYFNKNHLYLLPDMAFAISDDTLNSYRSRKTKKKLYFKRLDKELNSSVSIDNQNTDTHDWPSFEKFPFGVKFVGFCTNQIKKLPSSFIQKPLFEIIDEAANHLVRKNEVRMGLEFLSVYGYILTTRLHAMILGILLHTPVAYLDNTTGKLSAFADTWLQDLADVEAYDIAN